MMKHLNITSVNYSEFFKKSFPWYDLIRFILKNFLNKNLFRFKNFGNNFLYNIIISHVFLSYKNLFFLEPYKSKNCISWL